MRRWIAFPLIVICLATTTGAFAQEACEGPFKGKKPTDEQLEEVLTYHRAWMNARFPDGDERRANLCGAILLSANLRSANLSGANLSGANLSWADLTKARLAETNVKDADLTDAILTEAQYEAKSAPESTSVSGLKGLKTVRFERGQQDGLVLLRNVLEEAGLRELEREATFALEHWKTTYSPQPERFLKQLFFEATSCYGYCYERPLIIIGVFIGLFAVVYLIPISNLPKYASPESGIFRVWPSGRLVAGNPNPHVEDTEEADRYHAKGVHVVWYALYFSLLSTFHFGWRDLNVGNWISRIQGQHYALRATGWVRTVSGIQSLISIYLVALWVLTYFGRPFQ